MDSTETIKSNSNDNSDWEDVDDSIDSDNDGEKYFDYSSLMNLNSSVKVEDVKDSNVICYTPCDSMETPSCTKNSEEEDITKKSLWCELSQITYNKKIKKKAVGKTKKRRARRRKKNKTSLLESGRNISAPLPFFANIHESNNIKILKTMTDFKSSLDCDSETSFVDNVASFDKSNMFQEKVCFSKLSVDYLNEYENKELQNKSFVSSSYCHASFIHLESDSNQNIANFSDPSSSDSDSDSKCSIFSYKSITSKQRSSSSLKSSPKTLQSVPNNYNSINNSHTSAEQGQFPYNINDEMVSNSVVQPLANHTTPMYSSISINSCDILDEKGKGDYLGNSIQHKNLFANDIRYQNYEQKFIKTFAENDIEAKECFSTKPKLYESSFESQNIPIKQHRPVLKSSKSSDVILHCREELSEIAEKSIKKILLEKEKVSSLMHKRKASSKSVLHYRLNNLEQQQNQFEYVMQHAKNQFTYSSYQSSDILETCDTMKYLLNNERKLFEKFLPAYAFRKNILDYLANNQVLLISADYSYNFTTVIPLILQKQFPRHFVVSCEKSELQKQWLKQSLNVSLEDRYCNNYDGLKCSKETFVMTEQEMLEYSSNKGYFVKKLTCVVYHVSLNRTVVSDILLSNFKAMIEDNKSSKLVLVTSPYIDLAKYKQYFSNFDISELKPPNLTFPVSCVWKNNVLTPEDNYVELIIKTILAIHETKNSGNILAFVPSLRDAKTASKLLKKYCLNYHLENIFDVFLDESYLVCDYDFFQEASDSQTTVFFTTGSAEMITISSVNYVIDCGIITNYHYDSQKNIDLLSTVFISSEKAKLRKSLAGIFGPGTCYRIYSKRNYIQDMPNNDCPELLFRNPLNTLIKIYKYKPDTVLNLKFVEPMPEQIVSDTLQTLKKYGAIVDNKVSEIGENIIKLPFEAKYSKIVLLGIDIDLAFETVILVSFLTVKGRLFKHSDNPKYQRIIDSMQIRLIQHKSDTLTYLHIYKTWITNNFDVMWCKKHYINIDYLKSIQQKIDEMCEIVFSCLQIKIVQDFSKLDDWHFILSEILFNCFQDNLCVFSGRLECGFRVLSSDLIAFLHPQSIICQKDNVPQFLIFDHILSSDKNYLMNVTAIPNELIMKALKNSTLNYVCEDLFDNTLTDRVIEPVGEEVINHVFLEDDGEKLKEIIEQIKFETGSDFISVEPSIRNGCVYVYALPDYIDTAYNTLQNILKIKFEEIVNECQFNTFELTKDQNSVFLEVELSKGAQVTSVKVSNLVPASNFDKNNSYENETARDKKLAKLPYALQITWIRRPCNGKALVDFNSSTDLMSIKKLSMKHIHLLERDIFMKLSEEKKTQLIITGLPPETCAKELQTELQLLLPNSEIDNIELIHISPFETSDKKLQTIKSIVTEICKNVISLDSSEIVINKPRSQDLDMELNIRTNTPDGLESLSETISTKFSEHNFIITRMLFSIEMICKSSLCQALHPRLSSTFRQLWNELNLQNSLKGDFHWIINNENKDFPLICVFSNNMDILKWIIDSINNLLNGEVINEIDVKELQKLFCHGGHIWLRGLEADENLYIIEDHKRKLLRLYGSEEGCRKAKIRLINFLKDTENDVMDVISLSSEKTKNLLLKAVIEEYSVDLKKFIELCGLQSAFLDIRASRLHLCGNQESVDKATECVQELLNNLKEIDTTSMLSQEICPVCDCPAINLTYRLEHCGHLYCQPCIQGLVEGDTFPLQCIAKDCDKDLVLKDIHKILLNDPRRIHELLEKSIAKYLEKNILNIIRCPAPDCNMFFYKREITGNKVLCALCQNEICVSCNCIYHAGITCDFHQKTRNDPDHSYKEWAKQSDSKQCPRCKFGIEKIDGCNHITCKNCNGHFCWICPEDTATIFGTGNEVYVHINRQHPGRLFDYRL